MTDDQLDQQILLGQSRLARFLVQTLIKMEQRMSDLTDQIDVALTTLQETQQADKAQIASQGGTITEQEARITAAAAGAAALQGQVDSLAAGKAADEVELQKVLDVLKALQTPPVPVPAPTPAPPAAGGEPAPSPPPAPPVPVPPVPAPAPVDPAPPAPPAVPAPVPPTDPGAPVPPPPPAERSF